jgi:peroxiredoxin
MDGIFFGVVTALLVVVLLSQITLWAVVYQVVKQQGRLLLRLDQLAAPPIATDTSSMPIGVQGDDVAARPVSPVGLAVGAVPVPFRLRDLTGRSVDLENLRGHPLLLIHWNPGCGFCELIAPDLARMQTDLERTRMVLVSHGTADANRALANAHGLTCPILLQDGAPQVSLFAALGTPVAYLLDEQGRVARPLAVGAEPVLDMARAVVADARTKRTQLPGERPLSESRIERGGIKAGTLAPTFTLPDVRGGTVMLERFRGRRVLLVFTDPHCGPCDALAPDLVRLHRDGRGELALVMVGRGEAEENRRKAEQFGFDFPMALQQRWEISRAYGIFATPVAFLINERGVVVRDVAQGMDAILALAREGIARTSGKEREHERAIR